MALESFEKLLLHRLKLMSYYSLLSELRTGCCDYLILRLDLGHFQVGFSVFLG